jgi:hypothetical protein
MIRCCAARSAGRSRRRNLPPLAVKRARAPILRIDAPRYQARPFEPIDDLAGARGIDPQSSGEPSLILSGVIVHRGEHPVLSRGQPLALEDLGRYPKADLMEAARQMRRYAMALRHSGFLDDKRAIRSRGGRYAGERGHRTVAGICFEFISLEFIASAKESIRSFPSALALRKSESYSLGAFAQSSP